MTKQLLITFSLFVWTIPFACKNESTKNIDYLIYGVYCGECNGRCATMFKLDKKQLLVDTTDTFFKKSEKLERIIFNGDTLNQTQFKEAEVLINKLPKLLLQSKDRDFGNPDDHDQCGIYIQFKIEKQLRTFYIDTDLNKIPHELQDYARLVMKFSNFKPL